MSSICGLFASRPGYEKKTWEVFPLWRALHLGVDRSHAKTPRPKKIILKGRNRASQGRPQVGGHQLFRRGGQARLQALPGQAGHGAGPGESPFRRGQGHPCLGQG